MAEESNGKVWFITGTSKGFGRIWAEAKPGETKPIERASQPGSF